MPMMVSSFYGYAAALQDKGKKLSAALTSTNRPAGQADEAAVTAQLGNIGAAAGQDFAQVETNLLALGYRGISVHWLLLTALANSDKVTSIDRSDLLSPSASLLETNFLARDFARLSILTTALITNSAPGDMDWTLAKLYEGMAMLSQTPPKPSAGGAVLDEVLAFDFKDRPGRDHYVLQAVKWRIYAAKLSGDTNKAQALVQWVAGRAFRQDLKSAFLKKYKGLLTEPTTPAP
jgi:hypothetical protein